MCCGVCCGWLNLYAGCGDFDLVAGIWFEWFGCCVFVFLVFGFVVFAGFWCLTLIWALVV